MKGDRQKKNCIFLTRPRKECIEALRVLVGGGTNVLACVGKENENDILDEYCKQENIKCYTEKEMYQVFEKIEFKYETLLISYLFPHLIKKEILTQKNILPINFHPAPLPKYRGCACSFFFLFESEEQEKEYAVTAHYINEKFDEGDIIKIKKFKFQNNTGRYVNNLVHKKLLELLEEVMREYYENGLKTIKQDNTKANYYSLKRLEDIKKITKNDNLNTINKKIEAFWFPPYHGAYLDICGERFTLVNENLLKEISDIYDKILD